MKKEVIYKTPINILNYHLLRKKAPLIVSYLATYRCNQNCSYCNWEKSFSKELSTEEAILAIRQMRENGTYKLGFSGGECLVREDIDILLQYSHEAGLITSIATNGRAVPKYINAIEKYVDMIHISLDGPREIHDAQRGEGSYDAVIEAIEAAKQAKKKVLANIVLTTSTIEHVPYMIDLAKKNDFQVLFQPVFSYKLSANKKQIDEFTPKRKDLLDTVELLVQEKKRGGPIGNSYSLLNYVHKNWPAGKLRRCLAGSLFATLAPNGDVMPCLFLEGSKAWLNVVESGFGNAFQNSNCKEIVDNCQGCYCGAYIEASLIFSLNPTACLNALFKVL